MSAPTLTTDLGTARSLGAPAARTRVARGESPSGSETLLIGLLATDAAHPGQWKNDPGRNTDRDFEHSSERDKECVAALAGHLDTVLCGGGEAALESTAGTPLRVRRDVAPADGPEIVVVVLDDVGLVSPATLEACRAVAARSRVLVWCPTRRSELAAATREVVRREIPHATVVTERPPTAVARVLLRMVDRSRPGCAGGAGARRVPEGRGANHSPGTPDDTAVWRRRTAAVKHSVGAHRAEAWRREGAQRTTAAQAAVRSAVAGLRTDIGGGAALGEAVSRARRGLAAELYRVCPELSERVATELTRDEFDGMQHLAAEVPGWGGRGPWSPFSRQYSPPGLSSVHYAASRPSSWGPERRAYRR